MLTRDVYTGIVLLGVVALGGQLVMSDRSSSTSIDIHVPAEVKSTAAIPAGTILPIQLETTINANEAPSGEMIEARIMQDVPLPDREKLPARSVVKGSIISAGSDTEDPGVKVTLKFDQVEQRREILQITTYLRAIASARAVRTAQLPHAGADLGTSSGWADTVLIGGDVRYGDGGAVRDKAKEKVGKGVIGGVLVRVRANPARGCDGAVNGEDSLQALWVFSSAACGVYDLEGVKIARFGRGTPVGEITLHFDKNITKLEAGTAMLLSVASR
jgi:hypothetical protein